MLAKVKEIALPVAAILAVGVYFGFIGAGPKTPDFLKPKAE